MTGYPIFSQQQEEQSTENSGRDVAVGQVAEGLASPPLTEQTIVIWCHLTAGNVSLLA